MADSVAQHSIKNISADRTSPPIARITQHNGNPSTHLAKLQTALCAIRNKSALFHHCVVLYDNSHNSYNAAEATVVNEAAKQNRSIKVL